MGNWLKRIWNDSVWSSVIASAIIAFAGFLFSLLKSLFLKDVQLGETLKEVFCFKANVWVVLLIVMSVVITISVIKSTVIRKKEKAKEIPVPPFVNGFVEEFYQNLRWKWRWQWSKSNGFYYLTDLNLVCPNCKDGLLTVGYMNYRCGKCGADIPYGFMNADHDAVKNQILADARKRYSYCEEYIGEINSVYVKA